MRLFICFSTLLLLQGCTTMVGIVLGVDSMTYCMMDYDFITDENERRKACEEHQQFYANIKDNVREQEAQEKAAYEQSDTKQTLDAISNAMVGAAAAVATNQSNAAYANTTQAPVPTSSQTGQPANSASAGSQDELIASLKAHALPECVDYRNSRFYNICNFDIEITFCINNPTPFDKAPLTDAGAAYDCAKDQYGLWTIEAGKAMTGTFTGERATYSACKRPYSPVKIKGIVGGADHFACK